MAIEVFNRKEIKYLLNADDVKALIPLLKEHMNSDSYNKNGKTYTICNIYFDTSSDELIRKSLEKPVFKEKLRLRSYGQVNLNQNVYLEIKKKFNGVVNKRRSEFTLEQAYDFLYSGKIPLSNRINRQVIAEIQNILERYDLVPKVYISYERLAFFSKQDSDFRLTLDRNILTRRQDLRLDAPVYGEKLLPEGVWLMEAKAFKTFPLWFARFLSTRKIFKASFSKYGNEYKKNREEKKCQKTSQKQSPKALSFPA